MGNILSRFDGSSFYASYEKSFAKLDKAQAEIEQRCSRRGQRRKILANQLFFLGLFFTALAGIYSSMVSPNFLMRETKVTMN